MEEGKDLGRMGVQVWNIMVCTDRGQNDVQNEGGIPKSFSNTKRDICVTPYQLLSW